MVTRAVVLEWCEEELKACDLWTLDVENPLMCEIGGDKIMCQ